MTGLGPFDREHADAWSADIVDVASLNARASDTILEQLDLVRHDALGGPEELRSRSFVVLGPAGSGKTHLFARLRRRAGSGAAFVLTRPELSVDPSPRLVLAACVDALQRRAIGGGDRQLDVVVGAAHAVLSGPGLAASAESLRDLRRSPNLDRMVLAEGAIERLEEQYPEIEAGWLERFLRVPFLAPPDRRAMLIWLSGREPDASQLARLGLEEPLPESSVLPALRTLSIVTAHSAPIVLVFDQLENLVEPSGSADRIHAHARLFCELFDSVRGLVLVQMALDAEWERRIVPALGPSERSRLEARVLTLALPTEPQREDLRAAWVAALTDGSPRPAPWPFEARDWENWRTRPGVTPRQLLIAARNALAGDPTTSRARAPDEAPLDGRLDEIWQEHLASARAEVDATVAAGRGVDEHRIGSGLMAALELVGSGGQRLAGRKSALRVALGGATTDVLILQQTNARSLAAALSRACEWSQEHRVVVVRERALAIPPTWIKTRAERDRFLSCGSSSWVELGGEQIARLVALETLLAAARSRDLAGRDGLPLDESAVREWAKSALEVVSWPPLDTLAGRPTEPDDQPIEPAERPAAPVRARDAEGRTAPAPARDVDGRSAPARARDAEGRSAPAPARDAEGPALRALRRLGLASIDRVVREVRGDHPDLGRRSVVDELRASRTEVRWLGDALVASADIVASSPGETGWGGMSGSGAGEAGDAVSGSPSGRAMRRP